MFAKTVAILFCSILFSPILKTTCTCIPPISITNNNNNNNLKSVRQIGYVSSAVDPEWCDSHLIEIAETCQKRNAKLNITGIMIYREGSAFQIIEGQDWVVRNLFEDIKKDERHHTITCVLDRLIDKRDFQYWNFALRNFSQTQLLNDQLIAKEKPFCTKEEIKEFDLLLKQTDNDDGSANEMSQQVAKLIQTFQRTILRYEPVQRSRTPSQQNIWSRPPLLRQESASDKKSPT